MGTILLYGSIIFVVAIIVACVVICAVVAIYRRRRNKKRMERFNGMNQRHYMSSPCVRGKRVDSDLTLWSENGASMGKRETDLWCITGVGSQDFSSLDHVDLIIDDNVNDRVTADQVSLATAYPDLEEFEHEHTERGHATLNSRS